VKLWDVNDGISDSMKPRTLRQTASHPARVLAFSPDSEKLAIGVDVDVFLCDTAEELLNGEGQCLTSEGEPAGQVRALAWGPGLGGEVLTGVDRLLVGGDGASVRLFETTARSLLSFYTGPTGNVTDVAFSPDGTTIVAAGADKTGLWEVQSGPEGGTGGDPSRLTEHPNPDDVIDWVCGYRPTPHLSQWPESVSDEFRRDIC
jgi:WD40 repeat protein